jgi:isocitrate dehydrogenase
LQHRAKLDGNDALMNFCHTLEKVCVEVVESGKMTKDLAICIYGDKVSQEQYLHTEEFLEEINRQLASSLGKL